MPYLPVYYTMREKHNADYEIFNGIYMSISSKARPLIEETAARDYYFKNEDYRTRAKIKAACNNILLRLNMVAQNLKDFKNMDSDWYENNYILVENDNEYLLRDLDNIGQEYNKLKEFIQQNC